MEVHRQYLALREFKIDEENNLYVINLGRNKVKPHRYRCVGFLREINNDASVCHENIPQL